MAETLSEITLRGDEVEDYLFSSSTYGEVAVSRIEQAIMSRNEWIEFIDGNRIRVTAKGWAAATE